MTDNHAHVHAPTQTHRRTGLALAVICVAQLMIVLDATVMNVALPSIREDLGFSAVGLTWVITAYSLTFGGLLLFGGRTGDLYGRRRMFTFGVGLFAIASLLGGLAQSEAWLIFARALQGVGGAIAAPTALALIATTFREGDERNRAFGLYAAMAASGGAVGLLLGGILTDVASWRWALFINVPIGLFVVLLAPRVLGDSRGSGNRLDVPGAVTITAGMMALVYGLTNAATKSWSDDATIISLAAAAVLVVAFVLVELRSSAPLLPFRILRNRNRSGAYLTMLGLAAALFAVFFFTSQYLQVVEGWSPLRTGIGFLPMPLTIMFMSMVVVRRIAIRWGVRPLLIAGPALVITSMLVLRTLDVSSGYLGVLAGLMPLAFGMGCVFVPLTMTAVAGVAPNETGLASALLNTGQQLGGAVGLAVLGTASAHAASNRAEELAAGAGSGMSRVAIEHDIFVHGQSAAFTGGVALAAFALVASLILVRNTPTPGAAAPAAATPDADADVEVEVEAPGEPIEA
ncbi:MAG: transporter [Thermoleophilia bacterium]|nr:transporter [Thermoleophilia bacterium]